MKTLVIISCLLAGSIALAASTEKVKQKASETVAATDEWAGKTREEVRANMQKQLDDIKAEIDAMKAKAASAQGTAKTGIDKQLRQLEAKRVSTKRQLDASVASTGRAWDQVKVSLSQAMQDLKSGYENAKKEMGPATDAAPAPKSKPEAPAHEVKKASGGKSE